MKIKIIAIALLIFCGHSFSQTSKNFSIQGEVIYGNILKHTEHLQELVKGPVTGGELNFEWQTIGERDWHHYYHFPAIGVGLVGLDLGSPSMLGQLVAVYPYINYKLINTKYVVLNLQAGAGVSFLNKRFNNTATDLMDLNTGNAAIGSILNVYFSAGANLEVPLKYGFTPMLRLNANHASNGSFYQPNSGINMVNLAIGLKYSPNYKKELGYIQKQPGVLEQNFSTEIVLSGGARELYYKDNRQYPTGSVSLALYRQLGNRLRMGLGLDGFYDGVYDGTTRFKRTYLNEDLLENKVRLGICLKPELVFGKVSAGIHFGLYLYNPLKELEPYAEAKVNPFLEKPLIYSYDIEKEDGWFYTRAAIKYAITKHLFASLGLKTHLQKAEFIEWGLGLKL